ncbi:uncharacterized protein PAN0_123d6772 [Moesziomyces antarcticus]|uniref:Uncharacterized protein n=1 Tax=Pseudozyma antarctica TaxID=84753 RepID=A0A081CPB5_PSEA2|nr:uncharacterized protein PAN0_123d6772 [Moesziomyces antarcticus]GAK68511.1 hypothetical protein PAN0_123d6772 [Moesziomyces antarcticus]
MVSTIRRHFNTIKTRTGKNLMITDIMASEQEPEETQESDTEDDESGATTVRFEPSGAPESSLPRWMREKPGDVVMKEESRTTLSSEPMPSDRGTAWWPELHPERAYPREGIRIRARYEGPLEAIVVPGKELAVALGSDQPYVSASVTTPVQLQYTAALPPSRGPTEPYPGGDLQSKRRVQSGRPLPSSGNHRYARGAVTGPPNPAPERSGAHRGRRRPKHEPRARLTGRQLAAKGIFATRKSSVPLPSEWRQDETGR